MGVLSYFRKFFNYGLKFGLSSQNIRKLGFVRFLRRFTFKSEVSNTFRGVDEERLGGGERWHWRWSLKEKEVRRVTAGAGGRAGEAVKGEKQKGLGGEELVVCTSLLSLSVCQLI